jgi:hypothetical protein
MWYCSQAATDEIVMMTPAHCARMLGYLGGEHL